ncbi:hypothetical protein R3W88_016288 [Solanum pinnatisectum]|uniref:FAE domain-containing protein n=1 Tax=Solanum pinnatisectum TaxID=50273 RepID=A0AAV9L032_9SOLN|nr:hypothetical protein R3W88_016288 [Solanum pinnatisectum]
MDSISIFLYSLPIFCLFFIIWKIIDQKRHQACYILDYECYKPTDDPMLSTRFCGEVIRRNKNLGLNEYKFLLKAIVSSGMGEETYAPRMLFHDSIDKLFKKSKIPPSQIDVLVVNISMLATMPSLSSRIFNHYNASVISINIVQNNFMIPKNKLALVLTSESFKLGCCAIILTNKLDLKNIAMFELKCLVKTRHGAKNESYNCCIQKEDDQGKVGTGLNISQFLRASFVTPIGVDHFCLHTEGKAVIDGIARMTLHRYGNTSASSLWYVLGYMETKKRLKKRDVGDGNVWEDYVHNYPPKTLANPFLEKFGWLQNEDPSTFYVPDDYVIP